MKINIKRIIVIAYVTITSLQNSFALKNMRDIAVELINKDEQKYKFQFIASLRRSIENFQIEVKLKQSNEIYCETISSKNKNKILINSIIMGKHSVKSIERQAKPQLCLQILGRTYCTIKNKNSYKPMKSAQIYFDPALGGLQEDTLEYNNIFFPFCYKIPEKNLYYFILILKRRKTSIRI